MQTPTNHFTILNGGGIYGSIGLWSDDSLHTKHSWDIGITQEAASILYEDNNACIAMAMAQKPTPLTCHMDIKYHVLVDWIERNLLQLECIDTSLNMANQFTKQLGSTLFHQHADYILGKVPPTYSSIFKGFPKFISDGITKLQIPPTLTHPDPLTGDPLTAIH
jgi:hypothetical protein